MEERRGPREHLAGGRETLEGAFQVDGIASTKALLGVYLVTESPKEPGVDGAQ